MTPPTGVAIIEQPVLNRPALLVMLAGWIDAGGAAAAAMQSIDPRLEEASSIAGAGGWLLLSVYRARHAAPPARPPAPTAST